MRILLPGGAGQLGTLLARHLYASGHDVTTFSRTPKPAAWKTIRWDGVSLDPAWTALLEGADAIIHLSGKSVNCRYTPANRKEIIDSRVVPTRLIGRAIEQCATPPRLWMNASTSTFYRDAYDRPQDEFSGELGGHEPGVPDTWRFSIDVARRWEEAFYASTTPATRKIALRTSMTMSPDPGGVFRVLSGLVNKGLGGTQGTGKQWVSWIADIDFCRAIDFLIAHPEIDGPVNLTVPNPLPNHEFMAALRHAWGVGPGLPAYKWMLTIGTFLLRTETELVLKSRRVSPGVLTHAGFQFSLPTWPEAARNLVSRTRRLESAAPR